MPEVVICCDGGLGNRLNGLLGGLTIANLTGFSPIIVWPNNNWCDCLFFDLFENKNLKIRNTPIPEIFFEYKNNSFLVHENQSNIYSLNFLSHEANSLNAIRKIKDSLVYYHNKIPTYFNQSDIIRSLKELKIKSDILQTAITFIQSNNVNKNVKGLHIRKTDNKKQVDENVVFDNVKNSKNIRYFVCSDDQSVENKFNQLNNVIVFPKTNYVEKLVEGTWNTPITDNAGRTFNFNVNRSKDSIIEAYKDILILSRCNLDKVKNKSTFFEIAKLYSNINLENLR